MQTEMRERQISLRFSAEEWARAETVAAAHGLNVQNMLRMLVKREADAIGLVVAPKVPPRKVPRSHPIARGAKAPKR